MNLLASFLINIIASFCQLLRKKVEELWDMSGDSLEDDFAIDDVAVVEEIEELEPEIEIEAEMEAHAMSGTKRKVEEESAPKKKKKKCKVFKLFIQV